MNNVWTVKNVAGKGPFNNYVDKMRGGVGQKRSVFVHAQSIKTVHTEGGGVKKWQNSVHVVVECPLNGKLEFIFEQWVVGTRV